MSTPVWNGYMRTWCHNARILRAARYEAALAKPASLGRVWISALLRLRYLQAEHERRLCRRFGWRAESWTSHHFWLPPAERRNAR